jgi:hypothetical protein
MCNAWNHRPGCTCGWGGDGHAGISPGHVSSVLAQFKRMFYGIQEGPAYANEDSYLDPNAICPVCGAAVFFYRSQHNGRVFFDSMGPPWPKHPCTSLGVQGRHGYPTPIRRLGEVSRAMPPTWSKLGWQPFLLREASIIPSLSTCIRIKGTLCRQGKELFLNVPRLADGALLQVRSIELGTYEVSIMAVDVEGVVSVVVLLAWDNVTKLSANIASHVVEPPSKAGVAGGALADAFRRLR